MTTAFRSFDPRGARIRLLLGVVVGAIAWLVVPSDLSLTTRLLVAWDSVAIVLLAITLVIILRSNAKETRRRAAAEDPGRDLVWAIVMAACAFSLFAAAIVAHQTKALTHSQNVIHLVLSVAAVVSSWLLAHAAFTLRYAHLYYRDEPAGIEFPGKDPPDDFDFAYFAFTIGMTFQVSDAQISDRTIRRTVLGHALLSFAFNTVIVAVALNLLISNIA